MDLSFWWNFHHWLHLKLSKWQLQVQPVMEISSKWWHFCYGVVHYNIVNIPQNTYNINSTAQPWGETLAAMVLTWFYWNISASGPFVTDVLTICWETSLKWKSHWLWIKLNPSHMTPSYIIKPMSQANSPSSHNVQNFSGKKYSEKLACGFVTLSGDYLGISRQKGSFQMLCWGTMVSLAFLLRIIDIFFFKMLFVTLSAAGWLIWPCFYMVWCWIILATVLNGLVLDGPSYVFNP